MATFTIKGKVTDAALGTPVPNAEVRVVAATGTNFGKKTLTDKKGKFALSGLNPERMILECTLSYQPKEQILTLAANTTLNFTLSK